MFDLQAAPVMNDAFVVAPRASPQLLSLPPIPLLVKVMFFSVMLFAEINSAPRDVLFRIVPPEPSVVPVPVIVSPLLPVEFRAIPVAAPLDEMLRKVSPLEPIVVFATF